MVVETMYELGLPWRIWRPIIIGNRRSLLFEVSWCVMLRTTMRSWGSTSEFKERLQR